MNRNDGISITGGNVTAGAMAAGENASVTIRAGGDVVTGADPDVAPLLAALLRALQQHHDEVPPPVAEAGSELATELATPQPSPSRVRQLLATVTEGAASVTAVARAAEALAAALVRPWSG
jgi:hypothetical protein